ncbi:unnamed protein product, partial [Hapterophycus canaliculatus]
VEGPLYQHRHQHQEQRSSASNQGRVDKRLQFLLSVTEAIDCAAEEIVCGMGVRVTPSGESFDDIVRRMSESLWILARCIPRDLDEEDRRRELRQEGHSSRNLG